MPAPPRTPTRADADRIPTGEQWVIAHGRQEAIVTEVGATLRAYRLGDWSVLDGFSVDEWATGGRGQVLAPWPNRLGDGRYEFNGRTAQAALDEPERSNAIHGTVRWLPWRLDAHVQNVVALVCAIHPTPGYPYSVSLRVEYRLGRDGLQVSSVATNLGTDTAPFGLGFHPYLRAAAGPIDGCVLRLPATQRLVLDDRGLPTGDARPVAGTEFDFTVGRTIGPTSLDTAYQGLERDSGGRAWSSLEDPASGRVVTQWMDERFSHLMCYTGDTLSNHDERRRALAIEPMTCAPDALRSGRGLIVLEPGQHWEGTWGVQTT
jgi:galactose mutarotase-like enzyme